jgi:MoCo/4Fe-4S cofactor protein with predicted Tat translocation signal
MKHHATQREYWRSLEHLAQTPEVMALTEKEFGAYDPDEMMKLPPVTRRRFVQLMGASMALAGLTLSGCRRWPEEKLAPYTSNPKNRIPGVPEQYATVMQIGGVAAGLLVTSFDGRPIKIEGNPSHPFSQTVVDKIGAADAFAQASVLELYDPDRSKTVMDRTRDDGVASDWGKFAAAMMSVLNSPDLGEEIAILSESLSGPTTDRMKALVFKKYPKAQWFEYEPLSRDNEIAGSKLALGQAARQMLHLDQASIVVSFDADLLGTHPAHIRYASDWAARRDVSNINRVYIAESAFSITGAVADERLALRPSRIGAVLGALAAKMGVGSSDEPLSPEERQFVDQAAADLTSHSGKSVVAVGSHLEPELQALALALNQAIGAFGATLTLHEDPAGDRDSHFQAIAELTSQMKSGNVKTLIILGGNPAYDAPSDLDFATALKSVPTSVHLSLFDNETSQLAKWHVPRAHYLESWADARAWDGTISVCQPLIEPLYGGVTADQLLAVVAGETKTESDTLVRNTFSALLPPGDSDATYRRVLNDGLLVDSRYPKISASAKTPPPLVSSPAVSGFEIRYLQDWRVYDGRFAGNGWLQEMPDPLTKIVWDNAAIISKKDADQLGVTDNGEMLTITVDGGAIQIVAYVLPGQPVGVIGLPLGYGRSAAGHIGTEVGVNVYAIRSSSAPFSTDNVKVEMSGERYALATTQDHYLIDEIGFKQRNLQVGNDKYETAELIREATADQYRADSDLFQRNENGSLALQLYDPPKNLTDPNGHAWGMAIDLSSCIGCQACVIACQAENNVPIVGKDQVLKNRQMHWIRIDRYFKGDIDDPEVAYQPLTCQQCENAPCEQVCPVGATMHDTEGLNVMVYNRCVGTRYCSNNCPYKVRRFNYLDWHAQDPRHDKYPKPYLKIPDMQDMDPDTMTLVERMVFNPEVTVRMRGVMEKCTFCVQRIHNTKTAKRAAGQDLLDGDIITACQQACPTRAIVFGDLHDPNSKVTQLHKDNRAYALLDADLNTRPRNRFLAKISNPVISPALASEKS